MLRRPFLLLILLMAGGAFSTSLESTLLPIQWQGWWHQHLHDDLRWTYGFVVGIVVGYILIREKCQKMIDDSEIKIMEKVRRSRKPSRVSDPSLN